jgi:hypothetical protein
VLDKGNHNERRDKIHDVHNMNDTGKKNTEHGITNMVSKARRRRAMSASLVQMPAHYFR